MTTKLKSSTSKPVAPTKTEGDSDYEENQRDDDDSPHEEQQHNQTQTAQNNDENSRDSQRDSQEEPEGHLHVHEEADAEAEVHPQPHAPMSERLHLNQEAHDVSQKLQQVDDENQHAFEQGGDFTKNARRKVAASAPKSRDNQQGVAEHMTQAITSDTIKDSGPVHGDVDGAGGKRKKQCVTRTPKQAAQAAHAAHVAAVASASAAAAQAAIQQHQDQAEEAKTTQTSPLTSVVVTTTIATATTGPLIVNNQTMDALKTNNRLIETMADDPQEQSQSTGVQQATEQELPTGAPMPRKNTEKRKRKRKQKTTPVEEEDPLKDLPPEKILVGDIIDVLRKRKKRNETSIFDHLRKPANNTENQNDNNSNEEILHNIDDGVVDAHDANGITGSSSSKKLNRGSFEDEGDDLSLDHKLQKSLIKTPPKDIGFDNYDIDQDEDVVAPQMMIGEDGRIIINDETLVATVTGQGEGDFDLNNQITTHEDEGLKTTTSATYRKRESSRKWSVQENELFYQGLSKFGTDFTLIQKLLFPKRTRNHLKNKFVKEERAHPTKVNEALKNRIPVTEADYAQTFGS